VSSKQSQIMKGVQWQPGNPGLADTSWCETKGKRIPEWWPAVVFGWPAVIVSLLLAGYGVRAGRPILPLISAVLMAPLGYYLAGAQSWLGFAGPGILLSLVACAYVIRRGLTWLAWCLAPSLHRCDGLAGAQCNSRVKTLKCIWPRWRHCRTTTASRFTRERGASLIAQASSAKGVVGMVESIGSLRFGRSLREARC